MTAHTASDTTETLPATVAVPGVAPEVVASRELDVLVAEHALTYAVPLGALVHPRTVAVPDPHREPVGTVDPEYRKHVTRQVDIALGAFGLSAVVTALSILLGAFFGLNVYVFGVAPMAALTATSLPIFVLQPRYNRMLQADAAASQPTLDVPADVAAAYTAFRAAPAALRAAHASETVTGAVEDQCAYVDTLLVEAARLHAMDASATPEGLAVRDTMVRLASHAQALTTLAERNRALINAATLTTPMLLAQQPSTSVFADAAAVLDEETTFVRGALEAPNHL